MSDGMRGLVDEIAEAVVARLGDSRAATKRIFTLSEASEYTGLSPDAIRAKVAAGRIPVVKVDRLLRFDRKALDRWIDDHTEYES